MFQVINVIFYNKIKRHKVFIAGFTGFNEVAQLFFGDVLGHFKQVAVLDDPECNEVLCRYGRVMIPFVPYMVVVSDFWFVFKLTPHNPVVIIGGAVKQMAQDFFFAPFAGC